MTNVVKLFVFYIQKKNTSVSIYSAIIIAFLSVLFQTGSVLNGTFAGTDYSCK
jgi:hypothetical protein